MYDLEKYRDTLRGFYIDVENEVPGPILRSTDEIVRSIKDIDGVQMSYRDKYRIFYERFCKWDDGDASKKTVEVVFENE
ncbi:CDP-glycerol glycerophosphotransferase family protein [Virgibacillus halophilus]|uniref:CDP-glycerol glycerophosphotransferase family protein n=2 Tax=Tigheibacillus halophilus TaxID=361280 RepID=A0ABU5C475_9BACI|nr:CDP-glycerol glycerophosphotransferase family protein [Virgibacillus halophilus]